MVYLERGRTAALLLLGPMTLLWPAGGNAQNARQSERTRDSDLVTVTRSIPSEKTKDEMIDAGVKSFFEMKVWPAGSFYFYNEVDLDGDNVPEVLAYPVGDCGSGGCGLLVMKEQGATYQPVSHIWDSNWTTFVVSSKRTNGWNDLIVYCQYSNTDPEGHYVRLSYDGKAYPGRAANAPPLNERVEGTRYLSNPGTREFGVPVE